MKTDICQHKYGPTALLQIHIFKSKRNDKRKCINNNEQKVHNDISENYKITV